ncbi:hypothetical protein HHUSO_G5333 [Huso huso]|uniref:SET domain-containing protein n=1 Tax=Huso huso TaxID=61971 RepID=A0ABR1A0U1_HUSHU
MTKIEVNNTPHLCLFAVIDIKAGEEITYDYGGLDLPWRSFKDKQTCEDDPSCQSETATFQASVEGVEQIKWMLLTARKMMAMTAVELKPMRFWMVSLELMEKEIDSRLFWKEAAHNSCVIGPDSVAKESCTTKKKAKRPWTKEENMAVLKHFKRHISKGQLATVRMSAVQNGWTSCFRTPNNTKYKRLCEKRG